jgi:predicted dehydrogenase
MLPAMISVALVGCGAVAEIFYAPTLIELENEGLLAVRALVDLSPERTAVIARTFPQAASARDLADIRDVNLALIASPPPFHVKHTLQAITAGMDVLCEKPMATSVTEAESMIAAARQAKRMLAVGLFRRFFPVVRYVKYLIDAKPLGALRSFAIQEGGPFSWPAKSDAFFRKDYAGGGVLLDIGVHVLDLVVDWCGDPQKIDYADDAMGNIEANCEIGLNFANGVRGSILLSRDWQTTNSYTFEFEQGTVRFEGGDCQTVSLELKGVPMKAVSLLHELRWAGRQPQAAITYPQAFAEQLRDVVAAVETRREPCVTGEEALRSLRLIETCYAQRRLRPMPWLTAQEWKMANVLAGQVAS